MKDPHLSRDALDHETLSIRAFFGDIKGYFVEVGANEPRKRSQTWVLEQSGWTGVLVEPQPDLAYDLELGRKAKVFQVACSSPKTLGANCRFTLQGHCLLSTASAWRREPHPKA